VVTSTRTMPPTYDDVATLYGVYGITNEIRVESL
jgi:hypothetical protein